jgi:hypothetical protein
MGWLSKLLGSNPAWQRQKSASRRALVPTTWASSPAHLALLERFLSVHDADSRIPEHWEPMYGTRPQRVVDEMVQMGLLESVPLLEKITFCHTGAELKALLSSRGLKVSGKKADQAQRLFEADPDGMERLFGHRRIVRCTPAVSQVVAEWTTEQARLLDEAIDSVIAALRKREFETAVSIADVYRAKKFQPPNHPGQDALTIKPAPRSLNERAREVKAIFTMRPRILKGLQPEQWEGLYLNYAVWQLIGRTAPEKCMPGFSGLGPMNSTTVTRMLGFYIGQRGDFARWRDLGITTGKISCCNSGSCDACMALDKKTDRLEKLPEIPYEHCTCEMGCRCLINPVLNF